MLDVSNLSESMGGVYQGLGGAKPPPHEATYFQAFLDGGYCDNNMFNG